MAWCQEFGVQIRGGCDHLMVASHDSCACGECGTVCRGKFAACASVWAAGPVQVTLRRPTRQLEPQLALPQATPANGKANSTWAQPVPVPSPIPPTTELSGDTVALLQSVRSELRLLNRKVEQLHDRAEASDEAAKASDHLLQRIGSALAHQHGAISDSLDGMRQQQDGRPAANTATAQLFQQVTDTLTAALDNHHRGVLNDLAQVRRQLAKIPQQKDLTDASAGVLAAAIRDVGADLSQQVTSALSALLDNQQRAISDDITEFRQQIAVDRAQLGEILPRLQVDMEAVIVREIEPRFQRLVDAADAASPTTAELPQQVTDTLTAALENHHRRVLNDLAALQQRQHVPDASADDVTEAIHQLIVELPRLITSAHSAALENQQRNLSGDFTELRKQIVADIDQLEGSLPAQTRQTIESTILKQLDLRFQWLVDELSQRLVLLGNEVARLNNQRSTPN